MEKLERRKQNCHEVYSKCPTYFLVSALWLFMFLYYSNTFMDPDSYSTEMKSTYLNRTMTSFDSFSSKARSLTRRVLSEEDQFIDRHERKSRDKDAQDVVVTVVNFCKPRKNGLYGELSSKKIEISYKYELIMLITSIGNATEDAILAVERSINDSLAKSLFPACSRRRWILELGKGRKEKYNRLLTVEGILRNSLDVSERTSDCASENLPSGYACTLVDGGLSLYFDEESEETEIENIIDQVLSFIKENINLGSYLDAYEGISAMNFGSSSDEPGIDFQKVPRQEIRVERWIYIVIGCTITVALVLIVFICRTGKRKVYTMEFEEGVYEIDYDYTMSEPDDPLEFDKSRSTEKANKHFDKVEMEYTFDDLDLVEVTNQTEKSTEIPLNQNKSLKSDDINFSNINQYDVVVPQLNENTVMQPDDINDIELVEEGSGMVQKSSKDFSTPLRQNITAKPSKRNDTSFDEVDDIIPQLKQKETIFYPLRGMTNQTKIGHESPPDQSESEVRNYTSIDQFDVVLPSSQQNLSNQSESMKEKEGSDAADKSAKPSEKNLDSSSSQRKSLTWDESSLSNIRQDGVAPPQSKLNVKSEPNTIKTAKAVDYVSGSRQTRKPPKEKISLKPEKNEDTSSNESDGTVPVLKQRETIFYPLSGVKSIPIQNESSQPIESDYTSVDQVKAIAPLSQLSDTSKIKKRSDDDSGITKQSKMTLDPLSNQRKSLTWDESSFSNFNQEDVAVLESKEKKANKPDAIKDTKRVEDVSGMTQKLNEDYKSHSIEKKSLKPEKSDGTNTDQFDDIVPQLKQKEKVFYPLSGMTNQMTGNLDETQIQNESQESEVRNYASIDQFDVIVSPPKHNKTNQSNTSKNKEEYHDVNRLPKQSKVNLDSSSSQRKSLTWVQSSFSNVIKDDIAVRQSKQNVESQSDVIKVTKADQTLQSEESHNDSIDHFDVIIPQLNRSVTNQSDITEDREDSDDLSGMTKQSKADFETPSFQSKSGTPDLISSTSIDQFDVIPPQSKLEKESLSETVKDETIFDEMIEQSRTNRPLSSHLNKNPILDKNRSTSSDQYGIRIPQSREIESKKTFDDLNAKLQSKIESEISSNEKRIPILKQHKDRSQPLVQSIQTTPKIIPDSKVDRSQFLLQPIRRSSKSLPVPLHNSSQSMLQSVQKSFKSLPEQRSQQKYSTPVKVQTSKSDFFDADNFFPMNDSSDSSDSFEALVLPDRYTYRYSFSKRKHKNLLDDDTVSSYQGSVESPHQSKSKRSPSGKPPILKQTSKRVIHLQRSMSDIAEN